MLDAAHTSRPCDTISPYEMSPLSGAPSRAADTPKPLMNVTRKPASEIRRAESPSKQHGMSKSPGSARSSRSRATGLFGEGDMRRAYRDHRLAPATADERRLAAPPP